MGGIERGKAFQGQQWWEREREKNVLGNSLDLLGKKEGYLYPLKNMAVGAENADRIFWFKLEPDNPVEGQWQVFLFVVA